MDLTLAVPVNKTWSRHLGACSGLLDNILGEISCAKVLGCYRKCERIFQTLGFVLRRVFFFYKE